MEYPESGSSSHVNSEKLHDSVNGNGNGNGNGKEEDPYDATLRRAKEDFNFRGYFLRALTSGDDAYISRIFGGLPANDPRVSELIAQRLAKRDARLAKAQTKSTGLKGTSYFVPGQEALIAQVRRDDRKLYAERFRREYYFGRGLDQKTFVCPGGTHPWTDKSSGVAWLGVHGVDSICVVTKARDLDMTRVHSTLKYITVEEVLFHLRKTVISEIEDLASSSSKLRDIFGQSIPNPFGVVSVPLGTDDVHEESDPMESSDEEGKRERKERMEYMPKFPGYDEKMTVMYLREQTRKDTTRANHETAKVSSTEYHESEAIVFLQEKMKMNIEAFTVDETIETAISAFQHLFLEVFESGEIGVSVMDPNYSVKTWEDKTKDVYVKHLETNEIEGHLAAINKAAGSVDSFDRRLRRRHN